MRLAFPRMLCFVFDVSLGQEYADHSEEFLAIHPRTLIGAERHQWTLRICCFFLGKKRHLVTFTCESGHWTLLDQEWFKLIDTNQSGEITVRKLIIAMMRYQASEPGLVHQETSLVLGYSRSTITRYLSEMNFFFWAHTTSSHLDVQSDFIQDTGCASSIFNSRVARRLIFCSSTINLLWDDHWINGESQLQVMNRPKTNLETERWLKYQTLKEHLEPRVFKVSSLIQPDQRSHIQQPLFLLLYPLLWFRMWDSLVSI